MGGVPVTVPPSRPVTPPANVRPTVPGGTRPGGTAPRTPGLPGGGRGTGSGRVPGGNAGQTGNRPGRTGTGSRQSLSGNRSAPGRGGTGRGGSTGNGSARGGSPRGSGTNRAGRSTGSGARQVKAPVDRTNRVRSSGEVLGRRGNPGRTTSGRTASPMVRRVQPAVLGRGSRGKLGGLTRRTPTDRTKQGFTKQVIGRRFSTGFSRSPIPSNQVHEPGEVFGKRPGPVSPTEERRRRLEERHARKEQLRASSEGLSTPVAFGGVDRVDRLDTAAPTSPDPVRSQEDQWRTGRQVTRGVITGHRPVDRIHHDPGPITPAEPVRRTEPEAPHHDPGPTAFANRTTTPPAWP